MNKMMICGYVARDAETKTTTTGKRLCNFSVAFRKTNDVTEWCEVTAWENSPCFDMACLIEKGHIVVAFGEPSVQEYNNKNGDLVKKNCLTAEVIIIQQFLATQPKTEPKQPPQHDNFESFSDFEEIATDGDLPF